MGDPEGNGYGGGPNVWRYGGGWTSILIQTGNGQRNHILGYRGDGYGSGKESDFLNWFTDGAGSQDQD